MVAPPEQFEEISLNAPESLPISDEYSHVRLREHREEKREKMVGWYDPKQLLKTAIDVVVSKIFSVHSDRRLLEAVDHGKISIYDFVENEAKTPRKTLTIDFVADTGDGWYSTYSVAYWLARPSITLQSPDGATVETSRGEILIFGGDEVYPSANWREYKRRLIAPFELAMPPCPQPSHSHVFAIPGNHDWYDSLTSFTRLFISDRWFAGWRSPQDRSYFALKLPHDWWLLGVDVQLTGDIDRRQVRYFEEVIRRMTPKDRVILCIAKPYWVYEREYPLQYKTRQTEVSRDAPWSLHYLVNDLLQGRVRVFLSGDLHHYRRHATDDNSVQKITAGGGGAFLHPTHAWHDDLYDGFKLREAYPAKSISRRLALKNLLFLFKNPWFGLVSGILYLLVAWTVMTDISDFGLREWLPALKHTFRETLKSPSGMFWALAIIIGFILFTSTSKWWYRWVGGLAHGVMHLLALFGIAWAVTWWICNEQGLNWEFGSLEHLLLAAPLMFLGGGIVGSVIMGVYLLISLNVFGRHRNEAFSSLAIMDYKNFLRLHIDEQGDLTIYPIKIEKVPRDFKNVSSAACDQGIPVLQPTNEEIRRQWLENKLPLIEPPIVVRRRAGS